MVCFKKYLQKEKETYLNSQLPGLTILFIKKAILARLMLKNKDKTKKNMEAMNMNEMILTSKVLGTIFSMALIIAVNI